MKMTLVGCFVVVCAISGMPILAADEAVKPVAMQGFPPTRGSQATMKNYREHPFNQWTFRNAGAPLNVVMIPREGLIKELPGPLNQNWLTLRCLMLQARPWVLTRCLRLTMPMVW